jgi:hypothetical protein
MTDAALLAALKKLGLLNPGLWMWFLQSTKIRVCFAMEYLLKATPEGEGAATPAAMVLRRLK